jgi:hypothetical protein
MLVSDREFPRDAEAHTLEYSVRAGETMRKTIAQRVIEYLDLHPGGIDDDALAAALGVSPRQTINMVCRGLAQDGKLIRRRDEVIKKIVNMRGEIDAGAS